MWHGVPFACQRRPIMPNPPLPLVQAPTAQAFAGVGKVGARSSGYKTGSGLSGADRSGWTERKVHPEGVVGRGVVWGGEGEQGGPHPPCSSAGLPPTTSPICRVHYALPLFCATVFTFPRERARTGYTTTAPELCSVFGLQEGGWVSGEKQVCVPTLGLSLLALHSKFYVPPEEVMHAPLSGCNPVALAGCLCSTRLVYQRFDCTFALLILIRSPPRPSPTPRDHSAVAWPVCSSRSCWWTCSCRIRDTRACGAPGELPPWCISRSAKGGWSHQQPAHRPHWHSPVSKGQPAKSEKKTS